MFRRIRAILVSTFLVAAAVYLASASATQPPRYRLPDEVGFLEHRGRRYFLNDLFDPAYRAASDDPFVKQFGQTEEVADYFSERDTPTFHFPARSDNRPVVPYLDARVEP